MKNTRFHGLFAKKTVLLPVFFSLFSGISAVVSAQSFVGGRERISIDEGWKFFRYPEGTVADNLIYDARPEISDRRDDGPADAMPTEKVTASARIDVLKPWIMPTGNDFLSSSTQKYVRPAGNPGENFPFVLDAFDDSGWEQVNLPHDWAIKGPFYTGEGVPVGGGMGRLPIQGVAWYRRKLDIPATGKGRSYFLEVDGAMSYAMVWLNGKLVGGWPYGYNSWQVDLTPYIRFGGSNQLAIRVDNPANSARWYPGAGLYRHVWLTSTENRRVAHWGTTISTREVSKSSAWIDLRTVVENGEKKATRLIVQTEVFLLDGNGLKKTAPDAVFAPATLRLKGYGRDTATASVRIENPRLWGPKPTQIPHRYVAVTTLLEGRRVVDRYETVFGIRDVRFDAEKGLLVNGEKIIIKGANQHHDLGALGTAFHEGAAERQLRMLQEMGCNAIRMSHNPPAPELLDLTDRMGFLVLDEVNDCWQRKKSPHDFHLIFDDWSEQDLRAMIRRDRNHPSIIIWSFGNEVGEQYTGEEGAVVARRLNRILKEEDTTRPTTVAMNYAKPDMPLPAVVDLIGLNYQGEGIRDGGAYANMRGITTPPLFPKFHEKFPSKVILSTENASTLSSRGAYLFPVYCGNSAPIRNGQGGDDRMHQVSAYELYTADFGASPDKVFASLDQHPFVAGGFVWTGWDYLGEPTPYYSSRSSYCGIIDLAGFRKDRYYLYQSYWRPDFPMAHLLPHWTWPDRLGQVTPVHVFTSGDEAELFLNGVSMGRKHKASGEYRLRWDSIRYEPGLLKVVAYQNGKKWAEDSVRTAGPACKLVLTAEQCASSTAQPVLTADGKDICFLTVRVADKDGITAPDADQSIEFTVEGPADFVAADNGDATDMVSFASPVRKAFHGYCMLMVRSRKGETGTVRVKVASNGLTSAEILIATRK